MKKLMTIALLFILVLQTASIAYAWEVERPAGDIDIKERTENAYTNGEASVGLGVFIGKYIENFPRYGEADFLPLNVSVTVNSRMGIVYGWSWQSLWWISENDLLYRNDMFGVGDNVMVSFDLYIPHPYNRSFFFRFYGGRGSGEYQKIYVSTNGFISFDNRSQPSPTPSHIPSTSRPNALIAAVWCDLNVDSQSSITTGFWTIASRWYYVVMWRNVLHKASGKRLTFEIILKEAPQWIPANLRFSQSRIWISYKDVDSINTDFTYGIEDQQGAKGLGGLCSGSSLSSFKGCTVMFYQSSNSYFLKRLTLTFQDTNPDTRFDIVEDNGYYLRGHHIQDNPSQPSQPDPTYMFAKALAGTATLLIDVFSPWGWVKGAGFVVGMVLIGLDWVEYLAYNQYSGRQVDVFDMNDGLSGKANCSALTYDYVVDASLSICVDWILRTNHSGRHSLTIMAIAEYYEYSIQDGSVIPKNPISTSVTLKIGPDDNNSFPSAWQISTGWRYRLYIGGYDSNDYYKINVDAGYTIYVYFEERTSGIPSANVRLYLYNPSQVAKARRTLNPPPYYTEFSFTADSSGTWYIRVEALSGHVFYDLYVGVYRAGDGGCPILYVWNGSDYVCEGLLNIHNPEGVDVVINHMLVTTPARVNGVYKLRLVEHPQTHSYIDQVKLYAILANGEAVKLPLIQAWHSEYGNVLPELLFSDDRKTETLGADGNKGVSQSIDLKFAAPPNIEAKAFIFQIEGNNPYYKL